MRLTWHDYNYYPYERNLAAREAIALFGLDKFREVNDGVELSSAVDSHPAMRLAYFSGVLDRHSLVPTTQARLEVVGRNGTRRQATRYSVHGLHEYKGKFNPQVVRALLNMFRIEPGQRVLDPFCGSGTTLVECAHYGAISVGTDINPLAIAIARAKLQALCTPADRIRHVYKCLFNSLSDMGRIESTLQNDGRSAYLKSWFNDDVLAQMEYVRATIEEIAQELAPVFLVIASNFLRDYSQQDPKDLRIRRRKSTLPKLPFRKAFLDSVPPLLKRIEATQAILGTEFPRANTLVRDVTTLTREEVGAHFDAAVTSPPYAMALPYIDTQRLSLVWLGLVPPDRILELEARLIGSRELRGNARRVLPRRLQDNTDNLPTPQAQICVELQHALGEQDGFRRKAVPVLLYRYFTSMKSSFAVVKTMMKQGGLYGLIVGHNHTTIGRVRREIDTPAHLASLASSEGWQVEELIPLQTYRRYGYHVGNAVAAETLIILRNS